MQPFDTTAGVNMVSVKATDQMVPIPGIEQVIVEGFNINDRPLGGLNNDQVRSAIRGKNGMLANFIGQQKLVKKRHGRGFRSPFSCAEAHALALYCLKQNPHFELSQLRFRMASDDGRLMPPCLNCAKWLESTSNRLWYKVKPATFIAAATQDVDSSKTSDYDENFPPLRQN